MGPEKKPTPPKVAAARGPLQVYRAEGVARGGAIEYVKILGRPGQWKIRGKAQLELNVRGETVHDALRLAGRRLKFKPMVVREVPPLPK